MSNKKSHQHKIPPQTSADKLMERVVRDHLDLLHDIESAIIRRFRENPELDDIVVAHALRAIIRAEEPEDDRAIPLVEDFLEAEEAKPGIGDRVWESVYRVILRSVHNHSTLEPGDRGYLEFVAWFMPTRRAA